MYLFFMLVFFFPHYLPAFLDISVGFAILTIISYMYTKYRTGVKAGQFCLHSRNAISQLVMFLLTMSFMM